jgi:AcrR family transcriptional regulator
MEQAEIAEVIRGATTPHADATTAHLASGMHSLSPPEAQHGKGPVRVLAAACDEFFRLGYHGTSTRAIAVAAGMSATAVYAHYPSKESMLLKLCVLGAGSMLEALRKAANPSVPPARRLRSAVYAFAHWRADNHALARVAQWNLAALVPQSFQVVASLRREIERLMRSVLIDRVEAGHFVIPNLTGSALAMLSLCIDIARWRPSRRIHSPGELVSAYVVLVDAMAVSRRA